MKDPLHSLADALPLVLVYIDKDYRYRFANRHYEERYGRRGDCVGRTVREVIGDEQFAKAEPMFARAFAGESCTFETEIVRDGRTPLHVVATYLPIRGDDGEVEGIAAFSEDITERRSTERRLVESERQLRLLADVIPQMVWVTSPEGVPEYMNARWYEYTSGGSNERPQPTWTEVVHPDDLEHVLAEHRRAIAERGPFQVEYRIRRHDGVYRWHLARTVFIADVDGNPVKRFGTATDIHDQKVTEERLVALHRISSALVDTRRVREVAFVLARTLRDTLDAAVCAVFVLDPTGRTLEQIDSLPRSEGASALFVPLDGIFGKHFIAYRAFKEEHAVWVPETEPADAATLAEAAGVAPGSFRSMCAMPLVTDERVLGSLALSFAHAKSFTVAEQEHFLAIGRLAAQALARAALLEAEQRTRQEAERANRVKDEFLAMLGHELRNPLAPILTAVELMALRTPNAAVRERTVIERQVRHLSRLVDDLLDVSRIASGRIDVERARVDVADVVQRALEMTAPSIEQRRHRLVTDAPRGLAVIGDTTRLAQVLTNLLENASKYTPPGGRIELSARRDDGQVILRVRDDGIGIDAALLPRVFDLFTQGPQGFDRKQGGLGLGLAIARNIVGLHGGTIEALSDGPGSGTEIRVSLPLAGSEHPALAAASSEDAAPVRTSRGNVLIVDDNEDAAELLAIALDGEGYTTRIAHDGPSALALIDEFRPIVAVLDLGLPGMDGFELAQALRARTDLPGLRLVALTGYGQAKDRERTRAAGIDEHLVKPVDLAQVNATLAALTGTHPGT